jgi:hypothetical protein
MVCISKYFDLQRQKTPLYCILPGSRPAFPAGGSFGTIECAATPETEYWAFVAGFFSFHCTCALFNRDEERWNDAQEHLLEACSRLGTKLSMCRELVPEGREKSSVAGIALRSQLFRELIGKFGNTAGWVVESGYMSGLIFASLVGQTNCDDSNEVLRNLKTVAKMVPKLIAAVQKAHLPDTLVIALVRVQRQLRGPKNNESAGKCRDILDPLIESLLQGKN